MSRFEVFEDNGGGLHLVTFNDKGNAVYAYSEYAYRVGHLMEDLQAIRDAEDPIDDGWEGNVEDPRTRYDELKQYESVCVADKDGIYPEVMGVAASIEFGMGECYDEPKDYTPWHDMERLSDGSIPWDKIDIIPGGISRQKKFNM